ncbi:MAG: hypothetical protein JO081_17905 [Alphaproteobacteria bacterium]|nr:hypothetical protein [Alphaproteobacteria bacterium]
MPWSAEQLRDRVKTRAVELGRSVRSLLGDAGLPLDLLHKRTVAGHRIDTLERLAKACDWTLLQLLGFEDVSVRINPEIAAQAYRITEQGLARVPDAEELWLVVFCEMYNELAAARLEGVTIDEPTAARLVAGRYGRPGQRQ